MRKVGEATFVEHGGACPGYFSQVTVLPKSKLGIIVLSNAIGTEVDFYVEKAAELVGPALAAALKTPGSIGERDPSFNRYVGVYETIWGPEAVVRWEDSLAVLSLSTRSPMSSLIKLKKVDEQTFCRVREDDGSLGETYFFEVSGDGTVTRMRHNCNWSIKAQVTNKTRD